MLSDRQKLILKAIIEEYIDSIEPVGSKVLTEKPYLDFSSATIRYDMAKLEELGFLEKTHTSSGRIPSKSGYKYYVEHLVTRDHEVLEQFPLIDQIFADTSKARKQAVKEAVSLLSELTNYMTVTSDIDLHRVKIKKLDLIPLTTKEAVLLIVTNQGHVSNQVIKIQQDLDIENLRKIILSLNDIVYDKQISEVMSILQNELAQTKIIDYMDYQSELINVFTNAFNEFRNDNLFTSGMSNMLNQPEFQNIGFIKSFLESNMEKRLINLTQENFGLSIKVGFDNFNHNMNNCSVISVPYFIDEDEYGTIAVIGPTRMEYKKVIPLVEYIANNMSKLYKKK